LFFVSLQGMIPERLRKLEPFVFFLCLLAGTLPVVALRYYPTLDGPAHEYNARLIAHLLKGDAPLLKTYFEFTRGAVPNWTGHIFLLFFNLFLPAFLAEKAILLCYVIGLPLAYRFLLISMKPGNLFLSYLIFPFIYSYFFLMGFYNFNLALVFLFLSAACWIKASTSTGKKPYLLLFFLLACTYFSHIFVFFILIMGIGLYELPDLFKKDKTLPIQKRLRKLIPLFLLAGPFLLLALSYLLGHSRGVNIFLSFHELLTYITHLSPLISFSFTDQLTSSRNILYVLTVLTVLAIFLRLRSFFLSRTNQAVKETFFNRSDSWLALFLILLGLYFLFPDSDGNAGFVSMRLCLLLLLALLTWVSVQKFPEWIIVPAVGFVLFVFNSQIHFHYWKARELNPIVQECHDAGLKLEPNSLVMPLDYSGHWLMSHFANYLGHEKAVVILENYEASTDYFPLVFNWKEFRRPLIGNDSLKGCISYSHELKTKPKQVDYIFVWGQSEDKKDSCNIRTDALIKQFYTLVYKGEWVVLYKLN